MTKPVADESGNRMATDEPRESPAGWGDDLGGILEEGSLSVEAGADLPPKREYTALDNLAASEEEAAQQKERWIRTGLITVAAGVGLLVVVAGYQALFGMTPEEIAKREMIREFPRFEEDYEDLEVVRVEPQPAFDSGQKEGLFPSWMVVVDTLLGEGDLEAAREKMTAFAAQDPGDTLRAVACANLLLPEHAEKAKEVLETHRLNVPNASAAHFVLARTLTEPLEEWESALTLLKEIPPTTRETPAYLSLLYTVQEGRADWEGCILTLRTLLKVPGFDTPENQTLLAANYSRAGHMEKAKELFGDLLLQDGKVSEDAFWSYVEIREQLKELKPLMEVTQSLRRKDPSCSASLLYEAEYSLSRRQYSAALAQLDELEALEPSWRVEFLRAVTWMRMGKLRDARILLNKLKTEQEDDPYIAYNLGMVFRAQERDKLAYAEFARAFELDDRLWAPLCAMGQDYHATEQWDSARNVFERAQERSPNHPWIGELLKVEMNSKKAADWVVRPCLVTEYFESVRYSLPRKEPRLALIPHGNWQVEVFSPESRRLSELATSP